MKIYKVIIALILLIMFLSFPTFAAEDLISFSQGYYLTSTDLYKLSSKLAERYPNILKLEIIGYSTDKNPIYVVRMTDNINNYKEEDYVNKMHLLVSAGLHSRETYNSFVLAKIIEDYAKDYYDNNHLLDINVKELLKSNVIHFIVSANPDGYDLTKFGLNSVNNKNVKDYLLNTVNSNNYSSYKANLRGVDLNRNFEDIYYNTQLNKWVNQWNVNYVPLISYKPSSQFYSGPFTNSEAETQVLSKYFLKYDFRSYLSYHSQGRVIYYYQGHHSMDYNNITKEYANIAKNTTTYTITPPDNIIGYGYESYFVSNNTLKPFVTVETTSGSLPTPKNSYESEYTNKKLYKIPAEFIKKMKSTGYYDYKIYVDNTYIRDIMDKEYAYALSQKLNGIVVESKGKPIYKLEKNYNLYSIKIKQKFQNLNSVDNKSVNVNLDKESNINININDLNNTDLSISVNRNLLNLTLINLFK